MTTRPQDDAYRIGDRVRSRTTLSPGLTFFKPGHPFLTRWVMAQVLGPPLSYRYFARRAGGRRRAPDDETR